MEQKSSLHLDLDSILERYRRVEEREYQLSGITEAVQAINSGMDIAIDLPTGTGKTVIYSPIVAEVAESERRVAVLTVTKQAQRRVKKEIEKFVRTSSASLVFGKAEYYCPILNGDAQDWCCNDLKEEYCKPTNIGCDVIKAEELYTKSNLVVTNFAKFLLTSDDSSYDLIAIDDSHSFENAKEQAYQITIQFAPIRKFYESGISDNTFSEFIAEFLNTFGEIFERCVDPGEHDGVISQEYIKHLAEKLITQDNADQIKETIKSLNEPLRSLCWQIYVCI